MNAYIITLAVGMSVLLSSCSRPGSSGTQPPAPRFVAPPAIHNPVLGSRYVTATVVNDGGPGAVVFSVQSAHSDQSWSVQDTMEAGAQKTFECKCPDMPSDSAFVPSVRAAP